MINTEKSGVHAGVPDPGLACVVVIAQYHGLAADVQQLQHAAGVPGSQPLDTQELDRAARSLGLKTRCVTVKADRLPRAPVPALVLDEAGRHCIVAGFPDGRALLIEAGATSPTIVTPAELFARCNGRLMLFTSRASLVGEMARFDFSWFIPVIIRYRRLLLEVLAVSLLLQVFGLVSPLMFQVVMDKVLVNRTYNTLAVVGIALFVSSTFEVLLTGLRNYIFSHTTNRIDVELGARLFRHLVTLPLSYFGSRRVGDTVARVRELENIRNFLTGQALTAVIDLVFSVVFLGVMCLYSVWLTLIVAVSLPVYAGISALLVPTLRTRLNEKFARGADNQSFLVESVSGVETVKAMAVEPHFIRKWETQLAAYVAAGFRVTTLGNVAYFGEAEH